MSHPLKTKYIFLAGGHSAGPVMPLLAVAEEWRQTDRAIAPVVIDVKHSVAQKLCLEQDLIFERLIAGKLRRYWSWHTLLLPVEFAIGLGQALLLMRKYRPIAVLGAGGFVQLPVIIAAWFYRIPKFIHQQDVKPTLSNSLTAIFADRITVTFESSIRDFPQGTGLGKKFVTTNKVIWTGNPARTAQHQALSRAVALQHFGLHSELPVLLAIGGGTGAAGINKILYQDLPGITKVVQVVHATGTGKQQQSSRENYHPYEFISEIDLAYAAADVVISRAGLGALTALAYHKKPAIIIPMPNTHQEANAQLLFTKKAALVLDESETTAPRLIEAIRKLLFEPSTAKTLAKNLHELFPMHSTHKVTKLIIDYLHSHETTHKR